MSTHPAGSSVPESLDARIRSIYLGSETGVLEVGLGSDERRICFRDGDLYLPAEHPLARQAQERLDEASPVAEVELLSFLTRIAHAIDAWRSGTVRFLRGSQHLPEPLVGPLPTFHLVMELAVVGRNGSEVLAELGGEGARYRASRVDARLARQPLLDPEELALLERLRNTASVGELLDEVGVQRYPLLCRLGRFRALGWLSREPEEGGTGFSRAVARRFAERIAKSLERRPLAMDSQAHRRLLAELLAGVGGQNHYELLSVSPNASMEQIHEAYDELARLVHPSHAAKLSLVGREAPLEVLFERATEAYFTLSDPHRRAGYDRSLGLGMARPAAPVDEDTRRIEKKELARGYYERARGMVDGPDAHFAVDLMKDAVRYDPRAEYYVLLAEAQARNPNWRHHAVTSFRRALELDGHGPEIRLRLGQVLEEMEHLEESQVHYRRALHEAGDDQPGIRSQAEAGLSRVAALEREAAEAERAKKKSFWRRWFGG